MIQTQNQKSAVPVLVSALKVLAASGLLVLSARAAVYIPFSPVPVTAQTFALIMISLSLGRKAAFAAVAAYLLEGLAGLPVFAGGFGGIAAFFRPSAGFLFAFLPSAYVMGWCADKGCLNSLLATSGAVLLGTFTLYAFALPWLAFFIPLPQLFTAGMLPFLPGDALKGALAVLVLPPFHYLLKK